MLAWCGAPTRGSAFVGPRASLLVAVPCHIAAHLLERCAMCGLRGHAVCTVALPPVGAWWLQETAKQSLGSKLRVLGAQAQPDRCCHIVYPRYNLLNILAAKRPRELVLINPPDIFKIIRYPQMNSLARRPREATCNWHQHMSGPARIDTNNWTVTNPH